MAESLHVGAEKDEIADIVFMPGDPLRAKFIAENFLEGAKCYTQVRKTPCAIRAHTSAREFPYRAAEWGWLPWGLSHTN